MPARLLAALVGLPASYLDDVDVRLARGQVADLVAFVRAPWLAPLTTDAFVKARHELAAQTLAAARDRVAQAKVSAPPRLAVTRCLVRVCVQTVCFIRSQEQRAPSQEARRLPEEAKKALADRLLRIKAPAQPLSVTTEAR